MTIPSICRPWHPLYKWGTRAACIVTTAVQMAILNSFLVSHLGSSWLLWVIVDVICLVLFGAAIALSSDYCHQRQQHGSAKKCGSWLIGSGELRLAYIGWVLYALQFSARTIALFRHAPQLLEDGNWLRSNLLRMGLALSAVVFLTLIFCHHDEPRKRCNHRHMNELATNVAVDILDGVAILDVLFQTKSRENVASMFEAIVGIATVNLLLPAIPLFAMSRGFGDEQRSSNALTCITYRLLHALFGDIALLIIRLLLWQIHDEKISVFTIKNIINVGVTLKEFFEYLDDRETRRERVPSVCITDHLAEHCDLESELAVETGENLLMKTIHH